MRVALLGMNSASTALMLTASATVWFAKLAWTPATLEQAEDRVCWIAQMSKQVSTMYFVAKESLDMPM